MSKFTGVWGTFAYMDELTDTIKNLRKGGNTPTVISPCPRHEIDHALGDPASRVPFFSFGFACLGTLTGYSFTAWSASDWILPVSGKPIVAIPAFTIIGYELTILMGCVFTLFAMVMLGLIDHARFPIPKSAKKYLRFQRDRFGVVVRCSAGEIQKYEELLKKHGAEEVYIEK